MKTKILEKNSMKKDNISIGTMSDNEMSGLTDFCLICSSPGYHFNTKDANHFYIHKNCFGYVNRIGDLILKFKNADEVYEKNKDNIDL